MYGFLNARGETPLTPHWGKGGRFVWMNLGGRFVRTLWADALGGRFGRTLCVDEFG